MRRKSVLIILLISSLCSCRKQERIVSPDVGQVKVEGGKTRLTAKKLVLGQRFPGAPVTFNSPFSVVINDTGYFKTHAGWWKFDMLNRIFENMAAPPPIVENLKEPTYFCLAGELYVGLGQSGDEDTIGNKKFWVYNPEKNSWQEVEKPFPGVPRVGARSFSLVGPDGEEFGYVGGGRSFEYEELPDDGYFHGDGVKVGDPILLSDFYACDSLGSWKKRASIPSELYDALAFTLNGNKEGYFLIRKDSEIIIYKYDPVHDKWSSIFMRGKKLGFSYSIPTVFTLNNTPYLVVTAEGEKDPQFFECDLSSRMLRSVNFWDDSNDEPAKFCKETDHSSLVFSLKMTGEAIVSFKSNNEDWGSKELYQLSVEEEEETTTSRKRGNLKAEETPLLGQ
ncbi:MAG: hypothetical protein MI674_03620 [Cytophagales bacterium]|nr:hypothetical protein [Cytophagales bacterium]